MKTQEARSGDPAIRRSGDPAIRRAIRRSGDPAIRRSGDPAIRRSGDPAIRRSGDPAIRRSGDPAIRRSGDPAIRRSGDPAIRRSGDPAIRRSGDPAIRRSGDPAIRRSGDPAIRRSGDPAIRRSGDPAIRRSGDYSEGSTLSPCQPLRETFLRTPGGGRKRCAQRADLTLSFVEDGHRGLSEPAARLAGAHRAQICRASPVPFGVPYAEPGGKAIARAILPDSRRRRKSWNSPDVPERSTSTASPSSKRNTARQLPETLTLHWPARSPLRGCSRTPGASTLPGCVASCRRNRIRRSRGALRYTPQVFAMPSRPARRSKNSCGDRCSSAGARERTAADSACRVNDAAVEHDSMH